MNNIFLISVIVLFIYIFILLNKNNIIYVEAISGTKYLVQNDKDNVKKANLLESIVENMYKLKNYLVKNKNKYIDYNDYILQLENNLTTQRTTIYETEPMTNLTSYSVNKGEEVSFCLKSEKTNKLHDLNLMMYVAIHEMAHIGCPEIGHGELFKKIFKKFIEVAIEIGIYMKVDYNTEPVEYCGMVLSSYIGN